VTSAVSDAASGSKNVRLLITPPNSKVLSHMVVQLRQRLSKDMPSFQPAPQPKSFEPSPFVSLVLAGEFAPPNYLAADLACGYGRHTKLLQKLGFSVIAVDLDETALCYLRRRQSKPFVVRADLTKGLPVRPKSLGLAVVVHYPVLDVIPLLEFALAPEGYGVLESVEGRGENWRQLPKRGALHRRVGRRFEILHLQERPAGPPHANAVTVKAVVRKMA
jgi:SAM-dependent methyltransferase